MKIPEKFEEILKKDQHLHSTVYQIIVDFEPILKDNKLYFFEEYTDHGIDHIESVLNAAEEIITEDTYSLLSSKDIGVLILSIILHDLGMHVEYATFLSFLNGEYDDVQHKSLDKKTWRQLWEEYLTEAKRFSTKQRYLYFGDESQPFKEPDLSNKDRLDGADKKLIGEFIRRFHTRFAHEVAIKGLVGKNGQIIDFGGSRLDKLYKQLAGLIARSHGLNIRDTFQYLRELSSEAWKAPDQINVVFLMVVLRISDYFQFHKGRVDSMLLKLKTFNSPVSQIEHDKHLSIEYVQPHPDDMERLYVVANPSNSNLFVKISDLLLDIQHELDISWAVLGEIYSRSASDKQPKIKYRRITSNFEDSSFISTLPYVADRISFQADVELPKLLIAPLYGNLPTFGVRELIQNAVDACMERDFDEKKNKSDYVPEVQVIVRKLKTNSFEFVIEDNGKGMTLYEVKNFFLRVGSSFRKSLDWQKHYIDDKGSSLINRNGRFGIGILAAFLLGDVIEVKTGHFKDAVGYSFSTTIDTEQIEVEFDTSIVRGGTSIVIRTDKNLAKLLVRGTDESSYTYDVYEDENDIDDSGNEDDVYGDYNYTIPSWTGWYLLSFPRIKYTSFDDEINDIKFLDIDDEWNFIEPPNFNRVAWKHRTGKRSYYQDLICNGILIPNFDPYISPSDGAVISSMPTLVVTDNEGNLPLTLDRSRLDGPLPFIEDLIADLSKDFIAGILCMEVDPKKNIRATTSFRPNSAEVLFLREGFTFNIDYFIKKLNIRHYSFIRFVTRFNELRFGAEYIDPMYVLIPKTSEEIKLS